MDKIQKWQSTTPDFHLFDGINDYAPLHDEMMRAIDKHGWDQTPMSHLMTDEKAFIILAEEVGEVARALTYDEGSKENLRKELLQVAAMSYGRYLSMS